GMVRVAVVEDEEKRTALARHAIERCGGELADLLAAQREEPRPSRGRDETRGESGEAGPQVEAGRGAEGHPRRPDVKVLESLIEAEALGEVAIRGDAGGGVTAGGQQLRGRQRPRRQRPSDGPPFVVVRGVLAPI